MSKILPPTYFYALLIISVILHFLIPIKKFIPWPGDSLGIILILIGAGLNLWAWKLFINNKTTQNPYKKATKLVTSGPFKISRHPMYLGMLLIVFGESIILGSIISFISPIVFFIIIETKFIPLEEKNMEKVFGKEYKTYKIRVRRWI